MSSVPPGQATVLAGLQSLAFETSLFFPGKVYHQWQCRLIRLPFAPGPNLNPFTLTEANFVGYVPAIITVTAYIPRTDGSIVVKYGDANFLAGAVLGPQAIYGYALNLIGQTLFNAWIIRRISTPLAIANIGDTINIKSPLIIMPSMQDSAFSCNSSL